MVSYTDRWYISTILDNNGLQLSRYYVTNNNNIYLSSKIRVCPQLSNTNVTIPSKIFLIDFNTQQK